MLENDFIPLATTRNPTDNKRRNECSAESEHQMERGHKPRGVAQM